MEVATVKLQLGMDSRIRGWFVNFIHGGWLYC